MIFYRFHVLFLSSRVLPCWFIDLASADRQVQVSKQIIPFCSFFSSRFWFTSSSATFRGWNSIRISSYLIPLTTIFIGITQVPLLIFYTVSSQTVVCLDPSEAKSDWQRALVRWPSWSVYKFLFVHIIESTF